MHMANVRWMRGEIHIAITVSHSALRVSRQIRNRELVGRNLITLGALLRVQRLHQAGLIRRHFIGTQTGGRKAIYSLSSKGAKLIGRKNNWRFQHADGELLVGDSFTAHQTAVNWVWIAAKYRCASGADFLRWINFHEPLTTALPLIPDGYFEVRVNGESSE